MFNLVIISFLIPYVIGHGLSNTIVWIHHFCTTYTHTGSFQTTIRYIRL